MDDMNNTNTSLEVPAQPARVVLVGTYKGNQLTKWSGWYNYPLLDKDTIGADEAAKVSELWLFQGTKEQMIFKAEFVGVKTREELVRDYGYPAKGRAHGDKYLLFKTEYLYDHEPLLQEEHVRVIVRAKDFATSPKVHRQLKTYLESPDRNNPALNQLLPSVLTQISPEHLCVCEDTMQLTFWDLPGMVFSSKTIQGIVAKRSHGEAKPFVKWAGGKGQLLEQLDALLPADFSTRTNLVYVEPFVGGGAMLFHVLIKYPNIKSAVINDLNVDLMTCYRVIKEHPEELISVLRELQSQYKALLDEEERKAFFLAQRNRYNLRLSSEEETAALFIFLNRTCFNGLYRVNSKGQYNVPFGKMVNPLICDAATIRADSEVLKKVEIMCGDFEKIADAVSSSAFFYFDPPYRPLTQTAAFTAYAKGGFGDDQQLRLAQFTRCLAANGNQWLLSNSDPHNVNSKDDFFDDLFAGFDIQRVSASRMINSNAERRGKITELVIRNYEE